MNDLGGGFDMALTNSTIKCSDFEPRFKVEEKRGEYCSVRADGLYIR